MNQAVVKPKPPYRITLHLQLFTLPGEPTPYKYDPSTRTLRVLAPLQDHPTPLVIRVEGEAWKPIITLQTPWGDPPSSEAVEWARTLLRVDYDYRLFQEAVEASGLQALQTLASKYPGLRPGRLTSLYDALIDSIVKQRITLRQALRIEARLTREYGLHARIGGETYYWYPPPQGLAAAEPEELRALGLTRLKAQALRCVARAQLEERLPTLREAIGDPEGAAGELTRLYGVGPWTASLAVALVHPLFPVGPATDLAVRRGIERLLGRPLSREGWTKLKHVLGDHLGLLMYLAALNYELSRSHTPRPRRKTV